jgi:hypothetical protein
VVFHPGVIENKGGYEKVAGFIPVGGRMVHVAYFKKLQNGIYVKDPNQPIAHTAFCHELGHIVMAHAWDDLDQERHHAYSASHGLP